VKPPLRPLVTMVLLAASPALAAHISRPTHKTAAPEAHAKGIHLVPALPRPGAAMILDNDRGRAWDVLYPPGLPTGMHRHPSDFVGVELADSYLKVTTPDGQSKTNPIKRGTIYMLPKGLTHEEEGVAGHNQRNTILIELKDSAQHDYANRSKAPTGFAPPAVAKKVADNARVILWDVSWAPNAATPAFFQSKDMFIVPLDPGTLKVSSPDEPTQSYPLAAGQAIFLKGGHARAIQSTDGNVRAAVVELK
jgi:hypothetical protein